MKAAVRTIQYGSEYWKLHGNGQIERPGLVNPSPAWVVTGAVTLNNLGRVARYWTLVEIMTTPECIPWRHNNGKQKTFIQDFDHGTGRRWMSPTHCVF